MTKEQTYKELVRARFPSAVVCSDLDNYYVQVNLRGYPVRIGYADSSRNAWRRAWWMCGQIIGEEDPP